MDADLLHAKRLLRQQMAARRSAQDPGLARAASASACERVRALPEWSSATTVAGYWPHRSELSPEPLFALRQGRRLVLPVVKDGEPRLRFYLVDDPGELEPGRFGILCPRADPAREVEAAAIDLFLVPGLAFDSRGHRLGWGKGYYDATLAEGVAGARLGLCFQWQVVDPVPAEQRDVAMDLVVTDTRVLRPDDPSG